MHFTSLCNVLSKTLFADLDILCSKQVRDTRQTIRQKCLHFDGNIIGIRKFDVSSTLFLQSFFFKAFSSKLFFSPQSLLVKAPLQSPLSQSLSLKAPPSKPLLSKPFSQSAFLKASSSKPFLQSALLKALSFKTLRSKPLPSLQSVSPKAFSSKLLFKAPSFKALRSKRSLQSPLPQSFFFKASSFKASRSKLPVSPQCVPPKASSSKPLVQSAFPSPFLKALSSKPLLSKPLAQSLSPLLKAFSSEPPPQSPSSKPFLPKPLVQSALLKAFR